ncbi:MAG: TolC family protein [Prevotella sp.]|nr:TolC family protein [Prevotella sp.]
MIFRQAALLSIVVVAVMSAKAQTERRMTVDELFQLVESNSKTLQEQKISVEFAQKGIEAARAQRLPDVNASLSASYNGNVVVMDRDFTNAQGFSSPHFGNSFALEAQQVVYAGGAIDAGIRLAELQRDMAVTGQRAASNAQRFMALGQYLDLFKIQNRMQVYEQNIALTQRLVNDIRAKQEQGMALRNDVTRYELQMETLRLGLRRLQDQQAILNHQLCNTLGLENVSILPDTTIVNTVFSQDGQQYWQQTALTSSPQMEQSELSTRMAEQQLRLAKSELLPKLAVVAADNFSGPFTYDIPPIDKNINYWFVGVGVKYNISSLFKQNKKVSQAKTGVQRSQEQQRVVAESLDNQVQQAWTLYQQTYADLDTQRKSVQLARQNYQVVSDRYLNQLALLTDMLDASNIRLNAELQEVDARINIVYAYYKMKYISGTL